MCVCTANIPTIPEEDGSPEGQRNCHPSAASTGNWRRGNEIRRNRMNFETPPCGVTPKRDQGLRKLAPAILLLELLRFEETGTC